MSLPGRVSEGHLDGVLTGRFDPEFRGQTLAGADLLGQLDVEQVAHQPVHSLVPRLVVVDLLDDVAVAVTGQRHLLTALDHLYLRDLVRVQVGQELLPALEALRARHAVPVAESGKREQHGRRDRKSLVHLVHAGMTPSILSGGERGRGRPAARRSASTR